MYMHSNFKAGMLQISKNTLKFTISNRKQLISNKITVFQKLGLVWFGLVWFVLFNDT